MSTLSSIRFNELNILILLTSDPSADSRNLLTEEWISILKLSTMWNMVDHRKSSIQNLRMRFDYDPVTRVVLAQSHGIDEWLLPAYLQPAHRKEPLSALESSRLGYETAFKIVEARERAYSNMLSEVCNACADKFSPARSRIAQTHAGPFGTLSASTSFGGAFSDASSSRLCIQPICSSPSYSCASYHNI